MKAIKNFLLIGLGLVALTSAIAGIAFGAWHLVVIAICASVLYRELTCDTLKIIK